MFESLYWHGLLSLGIFQQVPNSDDGQEDGVYVDGHVNDVCDDSLDGGNIVQQNISPDRTHQQEEEKKQEAPVVRSNDKQKLSWCMVHF